MISEEAWSLATEVLDSSSEIVIACHTGPDGDALGSMLALGSFLSRRNKTVYMSWGSPDLNIPPQYRFLLGQSAVTRPDQIPSAPQVFVAVDCADFERLELLRDSFEAAETTIVIDHHVSNLGFGEVDIVEHGAAASAEIVYELLGRLGGDIDLNEATCLYTGLVTDTGRFMYSNASPQTLRIAAALREMGIDHVKIAEEIYESSSFNYLHVLGIVLFRAKFEKGMVWSWLEQKDLSGLTLEETEHFIDVLRTVQEAGLAVLLKEQPEGGYKASLRSRGAEDVSVIAKSLSGGGHARAAGFSSEMEPNEIISLIAEHVAKQ